MNKVSVQVMYPQSKKFDWNYYLSVHMSMVEEHLNPTSWFVMKGCEGMIPKTYQAIAFMTFNDQQAWETAFTKVGELLQTDIPKYTDAIPIIQVSDIITPS